MPRMMDENISIRFFAAFTLPGVAVIGALLGFLWGQIGDNRRTIALTPGLITVAVADNSQFQISGRIRVWDSLTETQDRLNNVDLDQARLEGRLEEVLKAMDRVIVRLDNFSRINP